jgi:hypothetical protein
MKWLVGALLLIIGIGAQTSLRPLRLLSQLGPEQLENSGIIPQVLNVYKVEDSNKTCYIVIGLSKPQSTPTPSISCVIDREGSR